MDDGDVEEMIALDHKARAIWELAGRLDLSRFAEQVKTVRGEAGRAAWEPQLMVTCGYRLIARGISRRGDRADDELRARLWMA